MERRWRLALAGDLMSNVEDDTPQDVWVALQDIANRVVIESNYCIRHPSYEPWELSSRTLNRIQQLPSNLQRKCLSLQLRSFLYRTYYNSSIQPISATTTGENNSDLVQNLENDRYFGVDVEFYERLHQSNSGEGYFNAGWQAIAEDEDGSLVVNKDGLTLYIERNFHLQPVDRSATVGDTVAIRFPKNLVQTGFYMAVGNAGRNHRGESANWQLVRVYFNFSPEGAVAVMGSLTCYLNELHIPFSFKVLYNPSEYNRYDSGVLYFDKIHYAAVRSKLKQIYTEHQSHFQPSIPLFTKFLAAGLGLAEEPERLLSRKESFGLNRCQIVADGLLDNWYRDDNPANRIAAIRQRFSSLGIQLSHAYLNANSEDIYTPLSDEVPCYFTA